MIVNHYGSEFGYELIAALPFAYWLYQNGQLDKSISNADTKCLYYFSENHEESLPKRSWMQTARAINEAKIPNMSIHQPQLDWSRWTPPPLNEHYQNDIFDYDVIVSNKYAKEWGGPPVNFLSVDTLDKIFTKLKGKKILYFHMTKQMGRDDSAESLNLNEWDMVKRHGVDTIQDVMKRHDYPLNHLQCLIYANCSEFITVQGGGSILASYFGGRNIIYAVAGGEIKSGAYEWYDKFGGSDIHIVNNGVDLCNMI